MTESLAAEFEERCEADSDIVDHLPYLYGTVRRYPNARVLELGVRRGNSTSALLAGADLVDGHVWSADIAWPEVPEWWVLTGRWSFYHGDDLDPRISGVLPDEVDVLFLDTGHTYADTVAELRAYVPRVVPGGTVLCHDTEWTYEHGAPEDGPPFPVAAALDTYCEETGMTWTNRSGCFGLGVMVR